MTPIVLRDLCIKIGSGATPRGGKDVYLAKGEVALIRSQNIYNDRFERNGLAFIQPEHAAQLSNVEVQSNDVLLNITGDSVARVCQVPDDVLPARVNQHVAIIRPDPERLDPRFLRFFLVSPQMQAQMLGLAAAGATRNALTKGMIEGFRLPNLSIDDQRQISIVLGLLEDKIELNRRMNETLEATARTFFKDWFVDFGPTRAKVEGREPYLAPYIWGLFPDAFDGEGKPEGWEFTTLDFLANTNAESWTAKKHPDQIEYVDLANTKWGSIELLTPLKWRDAPSRARRVVRVGDTLVGTTRPGNGSYAYISQNGLTASTGFAVLSPRKITYRDAVYLCATSPENIERLANLADGHGGAYPAVNPSEVSGTRLVYPGEEIMDRFAATVAPLRRKIEHGKSESQKLAQTRNLLLPKLMSGEIRLRDAEKQVEAVA